MKGYDDAYNSLAGLNPFTESIKDQARSMKYTADNMAIMGRLLGYFGTFSEVNNDDIGSISVSLTSLFFTLAVKDSRFVHSLARFTGLDFNKERSYDGKSINLRASVPEDHELHKIGITSITVAGYLPDSCKVVVKEYTPLPDDMKKTYRKLIEEGSPVYETICGG